MNDFNTALRHAQRQSFNVLKRGSKNGAIKEIAASKISMPATIIQELAFVATTNVYTFRFGSDRPAATAVLRNVNMGDNDIFAVYGIQLLIGEGATAVSRVYRSTGITPSDDSVYNGVLTMKQESDEPMHSMVTRIFREEGDFSPMHGFHFINPQRVVSGRLAQFNIALDLGAISGLTISSNLYLSVALHGAIARA